MKDDKEIQRKTVSSRVTKNPTDKVILVGAKAVKEDIYFVSKNIQLKEQMKTNSNTLINIPKGTHLDYISSESSWHKVVYKDKTGYVESKLVKKGNGYKVNGTLIVNKAYGVSSDFNPGVNPEALNAVNKMKADAKKEGVSLNIFSDFRSYDYQANLHNRYIRQSGQEKAETYSARPGYSEHQIGLVFDIGGANSKYYVSQEFGEMKEGIWMAENSYKYGLILRCPKGKDHITGYQYEPWHFRYVGIELAKIIKNSGLSLDEYLGVVSPDY